MIDHKCGEFGCSICDADNYFETLYPEEYEMLPRPLTLWVIRHKTYGHLTGRGDLGEYSGVYSDHDSALAEVLKDYSDPDKWEIVKLQEVQL